ncbi:MAG: GAF domain-containing protein [Stenomitos rutilans HA7619-LM2]|jgi:PAS domain S-box-containing protein|nr:GAF domain-containing protein [Stenomitos rutilans HA7619-LM2]
MDLASAQLYNHLSALEQENAWLRSRLQACEQSHSLLQAEITKYRPHEQSGQAQAEPKQIDALPIPKLLEDTATVANVLLTIEDFDVAVNTALRILGEVLETDRVTVIENFAAQADASVLNWRVLYEWDALGVVSQITHPNVAQGNWEGIESWYEQLSQGRSLSCLLEEMPEPFRSGQAALGLKALHVVPIFVEGKYWGEIGFDDCHEAKRRSTADLAVVRVAADCIGSAIQRERTQQALLQAEQARSHELEHHNLALQQALDHLAESEERLRRLFELSSEGFYEVEITPPCPISLSIEEQCDLLYRNIRVVKANRALAAMYGADNPDELIGLRNGDVHVADSDKNAAFIRGMIESGYRFRNLETEEIDRRGRQRYFLNSGVFTIQNDCLVSGWATQIDITELRETQQTLLEAEQLRSRNAAERSHELERYNTELQQALDRLAESERRYRTLFELSGEGIVRFGYAQAIPLNLTVDEQVDLCYRSIYMAEANPAFAAMYGYEQADDLIGVMLRDLHDYSSEITQTTMRKWAENQFFCRHLETEEFDRTGRKRYFLNSAVSTIEENAVVSTWVSQVDITELRETQQALLNTEQARSTGLANANDALKQTVDVLATETDFDRFLGHVLKVIAQQLDAPLTEYWYHPAPANLAYVGLTYWQGQILKPEEQPGHVGLHGYPVPPDMIQQESLHYRRSYIQIDDLITSTIHRQIANEHGLDAGAWYASRGVRRLLNVPLILGDRTIGALVVFLPSDRHFIDQQIELTYALAQQVTLAVQLTRLAEEAKHAAIFEERNRMAGEIHDTLAQAFTGISLQLEVAKALLGQDPQTVQQILNHVSRLAESGLAEARRSVWALYPPAAEYADLAQLLYDSVEQMTRNTTTAIDVNLQGTPCPLPPIIGMNLLRIGQEALTNALKHAQAQTIAIELAYEPDRILLTIRDNGRGFTPPTAIDTLNGGFGLMGMYERCDRIGALLSLTSQLGQGSQILVEAPLG